MIGKILFCVLVSLLFVVKADPLDFEPIEETTLSSAENEKETEELKDMITVTVTVATTTTINNDNINTMNFTELGVREYLETNLIGLHNMAITYLPQTLNYINIIEAYREIINGVKYELLVNTTNTQHHDEQFICRLVIQEKPWLITVWNEKYRELIFSNCSQTTDMNNNIAAINDKYQSNTLFNNQNTELTYDQLSDLESQIIEPKKQKTSTFNDNNKKNAIAINELAVNAPNLYNSSSSSSSSATTASLLLEPEFNVQRQTEKTMNNDETTTNINENIENSTLSEDAKYFIDNFFSFYSFGSNDDNNDALQKTDDSIQKQISVDNSAISSDSNTFSETQNSDKIEVAAKSDYENFQRRKRSTTKSYDDAKSERLFEKFKKKYNKKYYTSMETQMRYQLFKSNLIKINELNKREQGTAKYGITEFSDMTPSEFRMRKGLLRNVEDNRISNPIAEIPNIKLPKEFDWRKHGAVAEVKNQGNCGSCWAFSVTGNIEGLYAIKTGQLQEFSEQELIDCDSIDSGCNGGLPDNAYKAIEKIGGLELESEYPYKAKQDQCNYNDNLTQVSVKSAVDLPKNETAMALWLIANGPISIGINANAMQFYRGGISHPWRLLCRKGEDAMDHGVLIVGFGVDEFPLFKKTLPYWIVKNSWGPSWGEQGYYRVYRGDNTCGISNMATSAVI